MGQNALLLIRVSHRLCGIPLEHVVETMRPMPCEPVPDIPAYVMGLSTIRGQVVPVLDGEALFGDSGNGEARRFVLLKTKDRSFALAVDEVMGTQKIDGSQFDELPSVAAEGERGMIESVGLKEEQILLVLKATRMIPDEIWQALEMQRA